MQIAFKEEICCNSSASITHCPIFQILKLLSSWTSNLWFLLPREVFISKIIEFIIFQRAKQARHIKNRCLWQKDGHFWENSDGRMDISDRKMDVSERILTDIFLTERCFWEISDKDRCFWQKDRCFWQNEGSLWQKDGRLDVSQRILTEKQCFWMKDGCLDRKRDVSGIILTERWRFWLNDGRFWQEVRLLREFWQKDRR